MKKATTWVPIAAQGGGVGPGARHVVAVQRGDEQGECDGVGRVEEPERAVELRCPSSERWCPGFRLLRIHANSVAVRGDGGRQQHGAVHLNQAGRGLTDSEIVDLPKTAQIIRHWTDSQPSAVGGSDGNVHAF
jgi:hypothetical protein